MYCFYFNSAAKPTVKLNECIRCDKVSKFLLPLLDNVSMFTNNGYALCMSTLAKNFICRKIFTSMPNPSRVEKVDAELLDSLYQ